MDAESGVGDGTGHCAANSFAQLAESSASEAEESCSSDDERPAGTSVTDCWEERGEAVSETA
eukprot:8248233-Alexandrium_andersonii.AAC.1